MLDRNLISSLWQCVGRRDTYAVQLETGTYARVDHALTDQDLVDHLAGRRTLGTYVINEQGHCPFAVLDADQENGLALLQTLAGEIAQAGAVLHLERSRRGGHGWIFFSEPVPPEQIRAWLMPLAKTHKLELYPKQGKSNGVGSLIRLPLGIHRRSGMRYPFIDACTGHAVAANTAGVLAWLPTAARSTCPMISSPQKPDIPGYSTSTKTVPVPGSIREWNTAQDPFAVISQYIELDQQGSGHCPFGEHHASGVDTHSSFQVYQPGVPGGYCYFCHVEQKGGSVFDFLARYHGLTAKDCWQKIKAEGML